MSNITLSMIVKNEEKYLRDCLESVKDIVNEIVLVDTGSTDRTIEIANEYNAKVFHFDWINDFSAARNFALSKSTGDWILYLDADERLDEESKKEIILRTDEKKDVGYKCTVKSIDSVNSRDNAMRYVRLFANNRGILFNGKIHEQIEDSLVKNNYSIIDSKILINHIGYNVLPIEKQKKAKRNLELLLSEYKQNPSSYYEFQLANTYNVLEDETNARKYFLRAAESPKLDRTYRAQCFVSLALIAFSNHMISDADKFVTQSLKHNSKQPFAYLLWAKIFYRAGDINKAETQCRKAFELNESRSCVANNCNLEIYVNPEEIIYFGLTLALKNKSAANTKYYQTKLENIYKPRIPTEYKKYFLITRKVIENQKLDADELDTFNKIIKDINLNFFLYILEGYTDDASKLDILKRLSIRFIDNEDIIRMTAKTLDNLGRVDEAIELIEENKENNFENPAVLFYLISFYIKKGDVNKLSSIVAIIEKNYKHIPEVAARIVVLNEKLQAFSSKKT